MQASGLNPVRLSSMRAVAYRQCRHACVQRHLQIVDRIAYHQRRFRFDQQLLHQLLQHGWMRFGMGFVGATRGIEILFQLRRLEYTLQATRLLPVATASR